MFGTSEEAARAAAAAVAAQLGRKPASVLGLPTGRTSIAVYDELARLHATGAADFSQAHAFNIDEFAGVASSDRRSYCAFMQKHLFGRLNLPASQIHFLEGDATDHAAECARYERDLASCGGMDLLLLGIGGNAHIGFNEPGGRLFARTHRARLAIGTRRANAYLFGGRVDGVPRDALTMGVATMLEAKMIVLIATGRSKARAVASMLAGEISTHVPASLLQLHPNVEVILDSPAAEKLSKSRFAAEP
jgi:glucosamine-6-phosphate deaminase